MTTHGSFGRQRGGQHGALDERVVIPFWRDGYRSINWVCFGYQRRGESRGRKGKSKPLFKKEEGRRGFLYQTAEDGGF